MSTITGGAAAEEPRYPQIPAFWYPITLFVIETLVRLLTRYRVEGREHLPSQGPAIFVTNHLHHLDAPMVGIALPRKTRALAAEKYETHWFFGFILKITGCIFIHRGEVDRKALKQAMNLLEDGEFLAIAVEGTRSSTGALSEGKTGAAYLATRADAPLIPCVVRGTENVIPAWKKLRRAEVVVRYGPMFQLPEGRARTEQLDTYTEEIMITLAAMLPESYRGLYAEHPKVIEKASLSQG